MANVFKPTSAESVRHLEPTESDRRKDLESFKARKKEEQVLKDERFAKIRDRRKKGESRHGRGINLEVTGDKD